MNTITNVLSDYVQAPKSIVAEHDTSSEYLISYISKALPHHYPQQTQS